MELTLTYLRTAAESYKAEIRAVDFTQDGSREKTRKEINEWAAAATDNLIPENQRHLLQGRVGEPLPRGPHRAPQVPPPGRRHHHPLHDLLSGTARPLRLLPQGLRRAQAPLQDRRRHGPVLDVRVPPARAWRAARHDQRSGSPRLAARPCAEASDQGD